ncbi:MAG: hypothetical protein U0998_00700 [Moraxellaceae bacterium]|nr:hypothetical protein [Moraxellaceae bacterium]MDZ4385720.1 hypothetical protein [Moraxellaceae bacterium]
MRSCEEISKLTLSQGNESLALALRFERFFHLMMCGNCRLAFQQFKLMKTTTLTRTQQQIENASEVPDQLIEKWLNALPLDKEKNDHN